MYRELKKLQCIQEFDHWTLVICNLKLNSGGKRLISDVIHKNCAAHELYFHSFPQLCPFRWKNNEALCLICDERVPNHLLTAIYGVKIAQNEAS